MTKLSTQARANEARERCVSYGRGGAGNLKTKSARKQAKQTLQVVTNGMAGDDSVPIPIPAHNPPRRDPSIFGFSPSSSSSPTSTSTSPTSTSTSHTRAFSSRKSSTSLVSASVSSQSTTITSFDKKKSWKNLFGLSPLTSLRSRSNSVVTSEGERRENGVQVERSDITDMGMERSELEVARNGSVDSTGTVSSDEGMQMRVGRRSGKGKTAGGR